jgi:serine/threonine-protein kinase
MVQPVPDDPLSTNAQGHDVTQLGHYPQLGQQLGPYEILAPLGAGGMGEVYRARDTRLDREVAIKVLPRALGQDQSALARFEREAKAVAALSHPNILSIHDYGTEQGTRFAVMELLNGETLRQRLRRSALPWRQAVETGLAIAEGLAAAHAKGIIHRDLKPENLFLTTDDRIKILDFGLARVEIQPPPQAEIQPCQPAETVSFVPAQTDPGTVMGTAGYMSPEQVCGQQVDARSDIFSFGCVLYEMVAGKRAFLGRTAAETMAAILHKEPAVSEKLRKELPRELAVLLRQCLEKAPEKRLATAQQLIFALRSVANRAAGPPASPRSWRRLARPPIGIAAALLLLGLVGVALLVKGQRLDDQADKAIDSLAVLPFVNSSGDPEMEFLSDGITESLINALSQVPTLRVPARTTVFRYKGQEINLPQIGQALRVRAVLSGKIARLGDSLNIQVELVDVKQNTQLWGDQYQRKLADIFAIQQEIAQQICDKLQVRLTGDDKKRLSKNYTDNPEAYQLYLKGRFQAAKGTKEGLKNGLQYFRQALEFDPTYALAYEGMAYDYLVANEWFLSPKEAMPRSLAASKKALDIDEEVADAHTWLAAGVSWWQWDWTTGEKEYKRALALKSNSAVGHLYYGWFLMNLHRFDEAVVEVNKALECDPLSAEVNWLSGIVFHYAGRYDTAIAQFRQALELEPNYWMAQLHLGRAYIEKRQLAQGIAELEKARLMEPSVPEIVAALARAYALEGRKAETRRLLGELTVRSQHDYVPAYLFAVIHAALGDNDRAFDALERAYADRSFYLTWLKIDPELDPLRADPRFVDLLRRVKFPP